MTTLSKNSRFSRLLPSWLSDEARLSLGVAFGCLLLGGPAAIVNSWSAGTTMLDALLVVGAFYLLMGSVYTWQAWTKRRRSSPADSSSSQRDPIRSHAA